MKLSGMIKTRLVAISMIVILISALIIVVSSSAVLAALSQPKMLKIAAPIATSGNNVYIAWSNNDTGRWNVFFAKSVDGGKTFGNTIMLSAPNKGGVVNQNVELASSVSNVYVTWWTNKTGTLMPIFRASNDTGDTFGKPIMLNSTK
jgi:lipopolysaccharide export LptBFGC system permease protein LptF